MREMMHYLKPYWKGLIAATIAVAVSTVCDLLLPAIMSEILNRGVYQADFAYIVKCCAIMAAVALVGLGTVILGAKISNDVVASFCADVRAAVFRKVNQMSFEEFGELGTAALVTRCSHDVQVVSWIAAELSGTVVTIPVLFVGGVVLSLRKDVSLSLTMLAFVPVILAIVMIIGKRIDGIWEISDKYVDRQNEIMRERLRGIRVIRAFNSEKREHERVSGATRIMVDSFIRGNVAMGAISPLATFLLNVAAVLIVYLGGWRMETSTGLTGGDIFAIVQYVSLVSAGVITGAFAIISFPQAEVAAKRIGQVLHAEGMADPIGRQDITLSGSIEFDHVTFRYDGAAEAALNERIRADHIWLSNPVLVRGLGMAPVIGAALDGQRALMLCIASLILVTFTRVLAVAICHLTKNRFRPVVYCYSAALLYIPTYVLLYALFGSDLTLLGIYLPIMVVEPAIVKRMEFSDLEPVRDAFRHGFNNALGMCVVLLIVGCLRELLATGAVFGNVILHNALLPLAALPAGGFVIVGILAAIWCAAANLYTDYKHEEVRRLYAKH